MKTVQITQKRSTIATNEIQKACLLGLGLKRRGQIVYCKDTPSLRGMIKRVIHLVDVQSVQKEPGATKKISYYEVVAGVKPKLQSKEKKTKTKTKTKAKEKK